MNLNSLISNKKNIIGAFITFLCLLCTQFIIPINFAGSTMYLYAVEFLIIALFLITVVGLLITKNKVIISKKELIILSFFVLWFLALTAYRFFYEGTITGGFIIFRVLFFPLLLMLIFRQYKTTKISIFYGLLAFITYINIYQTISLIFIKKSFRQANALTNINIYLCFAIAVLPLLIYFATKYKNANKNKKNIIKVVSCINIFAVVIFAVFSGSRIAVLLCPVLAIVSYFFINMFNKKSVITFLISLLVVIFGITSIVSLNVYDAQYNFFRVMGPVLNVFEIDGLIKPGDPSDTSSDPDKKPNNDFDDLQLSAETNAADSNIMRKALWDKSIYYISQNPIFGRHTIDIDCEVNLTNSEETIKIVQSPHNFILEMWLALGLPGLITYGFILIASALKILLSKLSLAYKINFMLVLFCIFGFSFFQPLVTCYFAISFVLWITIYLFTEAKEHKEI